MKKNCVECELDSHCLSFEADILYSFVSRKKDPVVDSLITDICVTRSGTLNDSVFSLNLPFIRDMLEHNTSVWFLHNSQYYFRVNDGTVRPSDV
jgi:hypothetical protein